MVPKKQLVIQALLMVVENGNDVAGIVGLRVNGIEPERLKERGDGGRVLGLAARKEPTLVL